MAAGSRPFLRLFGTPAIEREGAISEIEPHRPALLLLILAYLGRWTGRHELLPIFWPDDDDATARHNLRVLVWRARKLPWAEGFEIETGRLRWLIDTDVGRFRLALVQGDRAAALAWQRAPLLAWQRTGGSAWEDAWLADERAELLILWRRAAMEEASRLAAERQSMAAAALWQEMLVIDPLDEEALVGYLEQASAAGQRDLALTTYATFRRRLMQEVALEPSDRTQALAAGIERGEPLPQRPSVQRTAALTLPTAGPGPRPALVGRAAEVERLRSASTVVTLVSGVAGQGKTRLLAEALPDALWMRCVEGAETMPLLPVTTLLREHLGEVAELGAYAPDLARLLPELRPGQQPAQLPQEAARNRMFEAAARALESLGALLVVDDLQWVDAATASLLALLASRGRLRIHVAARSDELAGEAARWCEGLLRTGDLGTIDLGPLVPEAVGQLAADLAGAYQATDGFVAWLSQRTGGNPYFVIETIRALFERAPPLAEGLGLLPGPGLQPVETPDLPRSIVALIDRRLARLSAEGVAMLQLLAVAGPNLAADACAGILGLGPKQAMEAREEIEGHGLVTVHGFDHDLLRHAVVQRMAPSRSRYLHGKVASMLQSADDPTQPHDPLLLAEHWRQAGQPVRAARELTRSASEQAVRGLGVEALELLECALLLAPLAESLVSRAEILLDLKRYEEVDRQLRDLPVRLPATAKVRALTTRAHLELRRGRLDAATEAGREALALSELSAVDEEARLHALLAWANVCALAGRQTEALPRLSAVVEAWDEAWHPGLLASFLTNLGWLTAGLGGYEEALDLNLRALRVAEASGNLYGRVWAASNALYCSLELAQPERALAVAEAALADGAFDASEFLRLNLGKAYMDMGMPGEAMAHLMEVRRGSEDPSNRAVALGYLCDLHHSLGDAEARDEALAEAHTLLARTDIARARARVAIATMRHGDERQLQAIRLMLAAVSQEALPGYTWKEFKALREAMGAQDDVG